MDRSDRGTAFSLAVQVATAVYEPVIAVDHYSVNDVIDIVQDAAPEIESWVFVPDIAELFGWRSE